MLFVRELQHEEKSGMDFESFQADMLRQGFEAVLVREWAPDTVVAEHSHPFAANAVVVSGEMWLTVAGNTRYLPVGGTFELAAGVEHSERYGAQGATYWVARRSAHALGT